MPTDYRLLLKRYMALVALETGGTFVGDVGPPPFPGHWHCPPITASEWDELRQLAREFAESEPDVSRFHLG